MDGNVTASSEWKPLYRVSNFIDLIGPVMIREIDDRVELRLEITEKHCNIRGNAHGGLIATLSDIILGRNLAKMSRKGRYYVTTNLNVNYVNAAVVGDVLIARVDMVKAGARTGFVHGRISAGDKVITEITGVFCGIESEQAKDASVV